MAWALTESSAEARSRTRTGSTSAPRSSKWSTPMAAQRWKTSSPSGHDAVGRMTTRGRDRPVDCSRPSSTSSISGRNSPAPTSATGPGIGTESSVGPPRTVPGLHSPAMTRQQRWSLLAAILGSSIVFLDGTIINVALPKIGETLPATLVSTLEGQTYVASGYLATLAALLILAGALADYYGRRRIFTIGLIGFGVTSLLCGIAPNLELLAVFRVLQGATGALLVPGSLSIITALFEGPARARAFGVWAAATSATSLAAPVLGGILVESVSWRAAFLINAPLVALALWATLRHMPETRDESATRQFDWLGAFVGAIAVGGLAFGAIRGQERQWQDSLAFIALGVGALATLAFPFLMAYRPHPLVPL